MKLRVRYDCSSPSTYSNEITANFQVSATITANPVSKSIAEGGNTTFSVTAANATAYQWQVSTDGGSTFSDITVAGSNPVYSGFTTSTLTLTGVVSGNNNFKYQCRVSSPCNTLTSNSATLTVTSSCVRPTVQANNITFLETSSTSGTISWTSGNGSGRIVYINTTNTFTTPSDGDNPAASSIYSGGEQCVYNGSGSSVTVSGLTAGVTYYARIYEYNCAGRLYILSTATNNPNSFIIFVCNYPLTQASSFSSNGYSNGMIVNWTIGDGDKRLVFINNNSTFTNPTNGSTYTANSAYSGSGQQCIYNGTGFSTEVTGLSSNTTYYFAIYEYSEAGPCYLCPPLTGSGTTTATNPTYIITSISGASYSGNFNGNVNSTIYLCYGAGVCINTNIPISSGSYSRRFQYSSDGGVSDPWFTATGTTYCGPQQGTRYVRGCLWDATLGVLAGSETPWLKMVHSTLEAVAPPSNCSYSYIANDTFFTVSWTPSATIDNAGGGLTVKHWLCYSTDPNLMTGMTWIDVSGLTTYTITGIIPGVTYYWKILAQTYSVGTNNGDVYCGSEAFGSCSITTPTTLPIHLIFFSADFIFTQVEINWSTASEINNYNYTLEKSSDLEKWIQIEEIPGAGNSNQVRTYSYTDYNPLSGISYYRLKQTDYDGRFEYFGPVSVDCSADIENSGLSIFPNPVEDVVNIIATNAGEARISICDITGRVIKDYHVVDLSVQTEFSLKELQPGIYLIKIGNSAASRFFRIIKK